MVNSENPFAGIRRSRRNLIKAGVIGASALLADLSKMKPAAANCGKNGKDVGEGCECFLKSTTIRTADGDRKIEDLAVGDLLPTVFGGICPIQWIGCYRFKKSDPTKAWVKDVLPIRIARSALGPDVPHADLYVTKTHALLVDGVLVAAGNLINGTTITRYDASELDELEFFHIKLELHDVIYAAGAPCETLLNVDDNAANFAEYVRQYGPLTTEETPCAPLFRYSYRRGEVKSCFRSAISPLVDRRQTVDIIRDKLDARGIALSRQPELMS